MGHYNPPPDLLRHLMAINGRLQALERTRPIPVLSGGGPPSYTPSRAGAMALDTTSSPMRLYCYSGSAWHYRTVNDT